MWLDLWQTAFVHFRGLWFTTKSNYIAAINDGGKHCKNKKNSVHRIKKKTLRKSFSYSGNHIYILKND